MVSCYLMNAHVVLGLPEAEKWDALYAAAPLATPFQCRAWLSSFDDAKNAFMVEFWEDGVLVGLWVGVRRFGVVRSLGTGPSDYLHPLAKSGFEQAVGEALVAHLRDAGHSYDLQQWPSRFPAPSSVEAWEQSVCPRARLGSEYKASLSRSLRTDLKRAAQNPNVVFVRGNKDGRFLDELFRLHALRWRARWLPGVFGSKARAFHSRFLAHEDALVDLFRLYCDGVCIGALYALVGQSTTYYYQSGFDPAYRALSPGSVLIGAAIDAALARGDEWFDFCRGVEAYKRRWNATEMVANRRLVGGPFRGALRLSHGVETFVRRRLEG